MHRHGSPFAGRSQDQSSPPPITLRVDIPAAEAMLLSRADTRIQRTMWLVGIAGSLGFWVWRGWAWAGGFALGAALASLNFHWMKTAVNAVAGAFSQSNSQSDADISKERSKQPRKWALMVRFFLRYALIAVAGYAIFWSSAISLTAFLLGLFVSVAGLMAEAVYQALEAVFSRNRGSR